MGAWRCGVATEPIDPRDDARAVLEEYLREIDRLETTVSTLLAVGRDRPPLTRDELDLEALAGEVTSRWDGRFVAAGRGLDFVSQGTAPVFVSRPVLDQILDVLLGNALAHGEGSVRVDVVSDGDAVTLTVCHGGSLERDTSTLFVRRDPDAAGHGLGLHLARKLAEAEGGRLVVSSKEPTTFRLLLPSHQGDRQREA